MQEHSFLLVQRSAVSLIRNNGEVEGEVERLFGIAYFSLVSA